MKRRALILFVLVVALLVGGFGLRVWQAKRQYALNRQLITALAHNAPQEQLRLVALGADPNTRLDAPPAPTFALLVRQLLHLTLPPANDTPTALMLACGCWDDPRTQRNIAAFEQPETLPLIQAMLAHDAHGRALDASGLTALHHAIRRRRTRTAALLLQHGARINAKDYNGEDAVDGGHKYHQRRGTLAAGSGSRPEYAGLWGKHGAVLHCLKFQSGGEREWLSARLFPYQVYRHG